MNSSAEFRKYFSEIPFQVIQYFFEDFQNTFEQFVCVAPEPGKLELSVLRGGSFKGEKTGQEEEHQASAKPAGHPHPDDEDEGEDEQVDNCVQHLHLVQGGLPQLTCLQSSPAHTALAHPAAPLPAPCLQAAAAS